MSQTYLLTATLAHRDVTWEGAKRAAINFEKDIAALLKKRGGTVYFHDYKNALRVPHSDTHILLECSEAFLEDVKKLPAFGSALTMAVTHPLDVRGTARRGEPQLPRSKPGKTPPHMHR